MDKMQIQDVLSKLEIAAREHQSKYGMDPEHSDCQERFDKVIDELWDELRWAVKQQPGERKLKPPVGLDMETRGQVEADAAEASPAEPAPTEQGLVEPEHDGDGSLGYSEEQDLSTLKSGTATSRADNDDQAKAARRGNAEAEEARRRTAKTAKKLNDIDGFDR